MPRAAAPWPAWRGAVFLFHHQALAARVVSSACSAKGSCPSPRADGDAHAAIGRPSMPGTMSMRRLTPAPPAVADGVVQQVHDGAREQRAVGGDHRFVALVSRASMRTPLAWA
jgi:hypothetical protein